MSLEQYNNITRSMRNAEYLSKLDRAFNQLEAGCGQIHELIEEDSDD